MARKEVEPAVITTDCTIYNKDNKLHRVDGPAIPPHWWYGKPVTKEEYERLKREYDLKKVIENLLK